MHVIADLQLHSRFSRAVSPAMTIPNIAMWARRKGIGLVATGDWTHPVWFREIERDLEEMGNGLLTLKTTAGGPVQGSPFTAHPSDPSSFSQLAQSKKDMTVVFLLATEVSSIYSQGGKLRRVHTLIWVPTIASARKISQEMTRRGCNLMSDGRPIIGLSCIHIAELVLSIEPKALIIPAHCLLPESMVLTDGFFPKQIQTIREGDSVYTHTGTFQKVTEVKKRRYHGEVITIQPWYFRPGLTTTPEHPYWTIRTRKKCPSTADICRPSVAHLRLCRRKDCLSYKPEWVLAKDLEAGDMLVYPRSKQTHGCTKISLSSDINGFHMNEEALFAGGTRGRTVSDTLAVTPGLGRLLGYYIAEGTTDGKNSFSFTFSVDEEDYINDLTDLAKTVFGIGKPRINRRVGTRAIEIGFSSKIHAAWLAAVCYANSERRSAVAKKLPWFLFEAGHRIQAEFLRGWYRGDKGYTSSRTLMNHIKTLCLDLGIIPSVIVDTAIAHRRRGNHRFGSRTIHARSDSFSFSNFAFFDDPYDLKREIKRSQAKLDRRHGWVDEKYAYLPIKDIVRLPYEGEVYNLEVENDHSYVTEFAAVHNCWTPWFSVYGQKGGFESLDEAFGPYAKNIYAVETGLSSNPAMNWRIKELDNRTIVSFSDAHSGPKLGREATVFEIPDGMLSYDAVYRAITGSQSNQESACLPACRRAWPARQGIMNQGKNTASPDSKFMIHDSSISYTIEFYPEEGKYHWSGHRACGIRWGPEDTAKKGTTCPVCGKDLVQGVVQRVEALAGRTEADLQLSTFNYQLSDTKTIHMTGTKRFPNRPPFVMLVPLQEIIAECIGSPVASPKVQEPYEKLTDVLGGEFTVLLQASSDEIATIAGARIAQGVDKVRRGDIVIDPGYDGVFGVVKLWREGEDKPLMDSSREQLQLL
jgi:PHP family Zn ribbon phosphoesterase